MNFYQAQDQARRKTWQLAAMFGAAVLTLVLLTNLLVALLLGVAGPQTGVSAPPSMAAVPADTWVWISLGVIGIIGTASVYKYLTIRGGGRAIAESLGGRLIHQSTQDFQQRRLLNVVEEMAIASGIAVPPVYLIPEASINAFAAGFTPNDAVIGINQGTLDHLSREELQGVIAHEFSHILNGDMNINLRLIAILHGILFIGMIGYGLLRAGGYSRKNGMPLLLAGAGLMAIGYGGTLFGNLIKAAVSRQREYLADASAVQFTRNPGGIADALKKIGGLSFGSTIENRAAEQASHMFFGAAAPKFARSLMATHPPLDERIRAIEPQWDGRFPPVEAMGAGAVQMGQSGVSRLAGAPIQVNVSPQQLAEAVGTPTAASLEVARQLISDSGQQLTDAAHDPFTARALVYAMLLDSGEASRAQIAYLQDHAEAGVLPLVLQLAPQLRSSDALAKLTLLEMAMPALKELSYPQYKQFNSNAAQLITSDGRVDVFEWVLHRLLVADLYPHFEAPINAHGRIRHVQRLEPHAATLLSILASLGHEGVEQQRQAYQAGARELDIDQPFSPQRGFDYGRMNQSLSALRKLRALAKPELIKACAATVLFDGHVTAEEGALLQAVAATLDCPLPPSIYQSSAQAAAT